MKPLLKIFFTDFWEDWPLENNFFTKILAKDFNVEVNSADPDIVIYSWKGQEFKNYHCIRIYYTPENWLMPKYKDCDFSLSFEYWTDPRNLRMPNYLLYNINPEHLDKTKTDIQKIIDSKTDFCSMVVSNPNTEIRNRFFEKLSKYKKVNSGGKHLNNIGGRVKNKYEFVEKHKFNICFENASHPGYTTEKIVQDMKSNTIPIYWGNPLIHFEFNTKSFFNYFDYANENDMIEDIIEHDKDDTKYYNKFIKPWFEDGIPNQYFDLQRIRKFLYDIIYNKDNYKPIAQKAFKQKLYYPTANLINRIKYKVL